MSERPQLLGAPTGGTNRDVVYLFTNFKRRPIDRLSCLPPSYNAYFSNNFLARPCSSAFASATTFFFTERE